MFDGGETQSEFWQVDSEAPAEESTCQNLDCVGARRRSQQIFSNVYCFTLRFHGEAVFFVPYFKGKTIKKPRNLKARIPWPLTVVAMAKRMPGGRPSVQPRASPPTARRPPLSPAQCEYQIPEDCSAAGGPALSAAQTQPQQQRDSDNNNEEMKIMKSQREILSSL